MVGWAERAAVDCSAPEPWSWRCSVSNGNCADWYERLGYRPTGETRPFPADPVFAVPMRDDLYLVVLAKPLAARPGVSDADAARR